MIWLIVDRVSDSCHVVENNYCIQGLVFVYCAVCAKWCRFVLVREVMGWGACVAMQSIAREDVEVFDGSCDGVRGKCNCRFGDSVVGSV